MTDFRALCEELLRSLENYPVQPLRDRDLCLRARAALAEQPVAVGPSAEELVGHVRWFAHEACLENSFGDIADSCRELIARWGAPTPQPPAPDEVAESVELVEGLKLISDGMSAIGHESDSWFVARAADLLQRCTNWTHWLPANALPTPRDRQ